MPDLNLDSIQEKLNSEILNINTAEKLEEFRVNYLGRKGVLAELTGAIATLPKEERAVFGQRVNEFKKQVISFIEQKQKTFDSQRFTAGCYGEPVDIGLPGIASTLGRQHLITQVIDQICSIFVRMGFSIVEGPEVETEYNNFTGLNIPLDHPSRDSFDTFYLKLPGYPVSQSSGLTGELANRQTGKLLLRSHTSPVQIRIMKEKKPPLAVVAPGRVYRPDAVDASHLFMFHQVEGFMVAPNVRFSDLKGVLEKFLKTLFVDDTGDKNKEIKMRLRPHFFPFTEPSAEVDISCIMCSGQGCSVCGRKGWLEIMGCGMIHPNVFKNVGYNPKKYSGFAFGMGVERIAMLKYGIKDIRLFFENDLRFLKQF